MTKSPFAAIAFAATLALSAMPAHAQLPTMSDVDHGSTAPATGPLPDWDVALVKPHPADDPTMSWQMTEDGLSLKNLPLEQMLCSAWDLKPYQLEGLTGWMKTSRFDLTAKVSGDSVAAYNKLNTAQRSQMLQNLLTERFQLKTHLDTRTSAVYNLVVDKSGSKLQPTTALTAPSVEEEHAHPEKYKGNSMSMGPGMFEGTGVSVRSLASQLANAVSKPVIDTTGLTGAYDIKLHFRPEDTHADTSSDAPSVFAAVQEQLGLKLVPAKGPVEILVVDAAQKPEAN